jgi:hypothetical protein
MTDYLHALEGRMRIKIKAVKGSDAAAAEISRYLGSCHGIEEVNANAITGNVLILYNSRQISQGEIIELLEAAGYLKKAGPAQAGQGEGLVGALARAVMETALQSMVMALI